MRVEETEDDLEILSRKSKRENVIDRKLVSLNVHDIFENITCSRLFFHFCLPYLMILHITMLNLQSSFAPL